MTCVNCKHEFDISDWQINQYLSYGLEQDICFSCHCDFAEIEREEDERREEDAQLSDRNP